MQTKTRPTALLLAMGNDLLGDDAVALLAARAVAEQVDPGSIDVVETSEAGLALMERMTGYDQALLMDSVQTGKHPVGSIIEFQMGDFSKVIAPSPHYAGMPEVFDMASRLGIPMPTDLRILAVEVANPFDFSPSLTPWVQDALPHLVDAALQVLRSWGLASCGSAG